MKKISIIASLVFSLYSGLSIAAGSSYYRVTREILASATAKLKFVNKCSLNLSISGINDEYQAQPGRGALRVTFTPTFDNNCKNINAKYHIGGMGKKNQLINERGDKYTLSEYFVGGNLDRVGTNTGHFSGTVTRSGNYNVQVVIPDQYIKPGSYSITAHGVMVLP
uniref:Adhesin protein n=1 Tax=Escherichia coli TaxID=562 RepID=Q8KWG4_ECOLX|nr:adhesin protein [Escherichia coli 55989]